MVYSYGTTPSANNLVIGPLLTFCVGAVVFFFVSGYSISLALSLGMIAAALPFSGLLLARIYGGGRYPLYTLDKRIGTLVCSIPAIFPLRHPKVIEYRLDEIVSIESVTRANDEPPPLHWRSIELRMQDETIKIYPGFDEATQKYMLALLHSFMFSD